MYPDSFVFFMESFFQQFQQLRRIRYRQAAYMIPTYKGRGPPVNDAASGQDFRGKTGDLTLFNQHHDLIGQIATENRLYKRKIP